MQRQKVKPSDSEYVVKNCKLQDFLDQAEAAKNKLIEAGEIPDAVSVASVFKGESKPHSFMHLPKCTSNVSLILENFGNTRSTNH